MEIPLTQEIYALAEKRWRNGHLIQNAFPTLTLEQREFIQTGYTPEDRKVMFFTTRQTIIMTQEQEYEVLVAIANEENTDEQLAIIIVLENPVFTFTEMSKYMVDVFVYEKMQDLINIGYVYRHITTHKWHITDLGKMRLKAHDNMSSLPMRDHTVVDATYDIQNVSGTNKDIYQMIDKDVENDGDYYID